MEFLISNRLSKGAAIHRLEARVTRFPVNGRHIIRGKHHLFRIGD
jgi:hypothetical protein